MQGAPLASNAPQAPSQSQNQAANWDGWEYAPAAVERLERGELIDDVAKAYGLTPRSLRVRIGKYAKKTGDPHANAVRAAFPGIGNKPTNPRPTNPAPTSGASKAVNDFVRLMSPEALVETCSGISHSTCVTALFLTKTPITKELKEHLPYSDVEKEMLKPWAGFAIEELPEALKNDPTLGLKIFLGILSYVTLQRALMIFAVIKAQQEERDELRRRRERPGVVQREPANGKDNPSSQTSGLPNSEA